MRRKEKAFGGTEMMSVNTELTSPVALSQGRNLIPPNPTELS